MRLLHFFEHVLESLDPLLIRVVADGCKIAAPGENSNAPVDAFFGGWSAAVNDLVGFPPCAGSDDEWGVYETKQCDDDEN